jgi:hypothetical protein
MPTPAIWLYDLTVSFSTRLSTSRVMARSRCANWRSVVGKAHLVTLARIVQ